MEKMNKTFYTVLRSLQSVMVLALILCQVQVMGQGEICDDAETVMAADFTPVGPNSTVTAIDVPAGQDGTDITTGDNQTTTTCSSGLIDSDGPDNNSVAGYLAHCDGGATAGTNADWYYWTAPADGLIHVTSNATVGTAGDDTRVNLFSACDPGSCITGDDDDGEPGFRSELSIDVSSGDEYYIQWDDRWDGGSYTWELEFTPVPIDAFPQNNSPSGSPTSATVTAFGNSGGTYSVEYGPQPMTPGTGTVLGPQASGIFDITGLAGATAYDYIVTFAAGGNAQCASSASGSFSTQAACNILCPTPEYNVTTDPFSECSAFVTIAQPIITGPDCDATTLTNDYNGTTDASDDYPMGSTTVTYTVFTANGVPTECTVVVNVEDNTPPTFTACPDDMTINLDAGECGAVFTFDVTAEDECNTIEVSAHQNCAFGPDDFLTQAAAADGGGVVCGFVNEPVAYTRLYSLSDLGIPPTINFVVSGVDFVTNFNSPANPVTVRIYSIAAGTAVPTMAAATLLGESTAIYPVSFASTVQSQLVDAVVPAGEDMLVEIEAASNVFGGTIFGMGQSGCQELGTTYVSGCPSVPGLFPDYTPVSNFFPFNILMQVNGLTLDPNVPVDADPGNPFGSGDELPIGGPYDFVYTATDLSGNVGTCEFSILVEEFPEDLQITALACNDNVQVSLDENCSVTLTADMILEGGPYGCYDTYTVTVADYWGTPVDADPTTPGTQLDEGQLDQISLTATVTDDDTGNSCWGNLILEDKQIPPLECSSFEVACDTEPTPGGTVDLPVNATFDPLPSTDNQVVDTEVDVTTLPGATVTDVNVSLESDHTWVGDLRISVTAPGGQTVVLLDNWNNAGICGGCAGNGLDLVFDDEATLTQNDLGNTCNNNPAAEGSYQPVDALSAFDGQLAAGTWTLEVEDLCGGDGGTQNVTLNISTEGGVLPFPLPEGAVVTFPNSWGADYSGPWTVDNYDPCGDVSLEYNDVLGQESCDGTYGKTIYRNWTATDESGNVATCTDTFNFLRASIGDLVLPADYDGLPGNEDPLSCAASFATDEYGHPATSVTGAPGGPGCFNISATYNDIVIPICGGDGGYYKILRVWTILDWCTGEVVNHNQIIKVVDFTAPTISVADDVTVSTDIWGCEYTLDLDDLGIEISDDCDDDLEINVIPPAGTELNKGIHQITVQAVDDCGNLAEAIVDLEVLDNVPPIVVVDDEVRVTLTSDGSAKAFAESFDEGSFDGCGPVTIAVRRSGVNPCGLSTQFGPYVEFCCSDVPVSPVEVQFQATDHSGNVNTGWIYVTVEDKLPPAIVCPEDVTLTCLDDYQAIIDNSGTELEDLPADVTEILGTPSFGAACTASVTYTAGGSVDECGEGTINVTWFVNTESGQSGGCLQRVYVVKEAQNSLQCNDISFPAGSQEAITYGAQPWCEVNDGVNDNDDDQPAIQITDCSGPSITAPELDNDELCTAIGISMTADTFDFAGGACQKIIVHWEVIDHCVFDENYVDVETGEIDPFHNDNGYFEFFAEYDIFDNEGPEVTCVEDFVVNCTENFTGPIVAEATDNCSDPSVFGYSWQLDAGNDGTIDFQGTGGEITAGMVGLAYFPLGEHRVVWNVNDGCGNNTNQACVFNISQEDNKAPTPYCYDGLSTATMLVGGVELWAADFDAGSFDDCDDEVTVTMIPESDAEGLSNEEAWAASTAGWTFGCDYIPNGVSATFEVRIYATDDDGNYDYCSATLRIDDNLDQCEDDPDVSATVAGRAQTETSIDIELAEITLGSTHPEYPEFTDSDGNGQYEFLENPMYYDYFVSGSRDFGYLDGVSTLDLVLIQKYILGLTTFDSAYKVIASDINNDEKVSALDLVQLRKLILGLYENDDLPNNESWKFVDGNQGFTDINSPWPVNEVITIAELSEHMMNENFVGVKIGDVNGSVNPAGFQTSEIRNGNAMNLEVLESEVIAGETYKVSFTAADFAEVYGYQFTLNFDSNIMKYVGFESGALNMSEANFGSNRLNDGILTSSWDNVNGMSVNSDETLFTLVFQGLRKGQLSNALSLNSRVTPAEVYRSKDLNVAGISLVFRTDAGVVESNVIELYQNEPNPFTEETEIGFNLPEGGKASVTVYDVTGKVLKIVDGDFSKGFNSIRMNKSELGASGVLYYQLESGDFTATKKMIILE